MKTFFTLDYELFMGEKTGTVDKCLITPMEKLLEVTCKYDIKMTIFVDAAYLLRMSQLLDAEPSLRSDYEKVVANIKALDSMGHDIELHFHPQWLFSDYKEGVWNLDMMHYKLSDVEDLEEKFNAAKKLLESIIKKEVVAFRAGGYSIQTCNYYCLFKNAGISYDSSVLRKHKCKSEYQYYNYSNIPSKQIYRFGQDICKEDPNGPFCEFSITSVSFSIFFYCFYRIWLKISLRGDKKFGDGSPIKVTKSKLSIKLRKNVSASFDKFSAPLLPWVLLKSRKVDSLILIGHPKNISLKSLQYLDRFLSSYKGKLDFYTISETK